MNENQKIIINGNLWFVFFPYTLDDAIKNHCRFEYNAEQLSSLGTMGKYWKFIDNIRGLELNDNKATLVQNAEEINGSITVIVDGVESIDVSFAKGNKHIVLEKSIFHGYMVGNIEFDFKNPITKIKLNFRYDLAEPLVVDINTILYKEPPIDYEKIHEQNMAIKHSVGENLVNVYFKYADDKITTVKVELYLADKDNDQLLGLYRANDGMMFLAITGLAYGNYKYKVLQYIDNELFASSKKIAFSLKPSSQNRRRGQYVPHSDNRD